MTDYRDSSPRGQNDSRDDPGQRWRRNEDRYRREAGSGEYENRFDDDRYEANRRNRELGYGRAQRDDYYAGRDYGRDRDRAENDQPVRHWHERDREMRAGHPYAGTYGGTGDSRYFTGTQGSWAVGGSDSPRSYYGGGQRFGADYRPHGYDADDDGRRGFWDRASDEVASWFGDEDAARRREDDHRGHGPKGYIRSDERIREDANDRLTEDWRVDASDVTVTVKDGEITLDGTVANREAKRRAEDVVDGITGVKHVQNNLRVQPTASGGAYTGNWATNATSTAEGGTLSQTSTSADKQGSKF